MKTRLAIISGLMVCTFACRDTDKTTYQDDRKMEKVGEEKVEAMEKAREWKDNGSGVRESLANDDIHGVKVDSNLTNH